MAADLSVGKDHAGRAMYERKAPLTTLYRPDTRITTGTHPYLQQLITGCLHSPHATDRVRRRFEDLLPAYLGRMRFTLIGDLTCHPLENPLRNAKNIAKKYGLDYVKMEEEIWREATREAQMGAPGVLIYLVKMYLPTYDASKVNLDILEQIANGRKEDGRRMGGPLIEGPIIDTTGNDFDKDRRVFFAQKGAEWIEKREGMGKEGGSEPLYTSLEELIRDSSFIRKIQGIEFDFFQMRDGTYNMILRVPYTENLTKEVLDGHLKDVSSVLSGPFIPGTEISLAKVSQGVIQSHNNSNRLWRIEDNTDWFHHLYGQLGRLNIPLHHISAHVHHTYDMHRFRDVWQYGVGFGDSAQKLTDEQKGFYAGKRQTHLHRLMEFDPSLPFNPASKSWKPFTDIELDLALLAHSLTFPDAYLLEAENTPTAHVPNMPPQVRADAERGLQRITGKIFAKHGIDLERLAV